MSLAISIADVTPEQPKNWLTDFVVYVIVFEPHTTDPLSPKPIVESTEIVESIPTSELLRIYISDDSFTCSGPIGTCVRRFQHHCVTKIDFPVKIYFPIKH